MAVTSTSSYIVSRPTGFKIDAQIVVTRSFHTVSSVSTSSSTDTPTISNKKTVPRQNDRLAEYDEAAGDTTTTTGSSIATATATTKPERPIINNEHSKRTFFYQSQGPAKCIYNRTLYDKVVISSKVTEILPEVFANWTSLEQVIFEYPSQCKWIGANAFYGCGKLTKLDDDTLPDSIEVIGSNAFAHCDGLESVTLPTSVLVLRQQAFRGCTALKAVLLPSKLRTIGFGAFADCINLQHVRLPYDLKRIESSVFQHCHSLHTLNVTAPYYQKDDHPSNNKRKIQKTRYNWQNVDYNTIRLPPELLSIGDEAFLGCHCLAESLVLPKTVTSLGNYVFEDCQQLYEITLPSRIQMVGDGCFRRCTSLERLRLPLDVAFGVAAFEQCYHLKELVDIATETVIDIHS